MILGNTMEAPAQRPEDSMPPRTLVVENLAARNNLQSHEAPVVKRERSPDRDQSHEGPVAKTESHEAPVVKRERSPDGDQARAFILPDTDGTRALKSVVTDIRVTILSVVVTAIRVTIMSIVLTAIRQLQQQIQQGLDDKIKDLDSKLAPPQAPGGGPWEIFLPRPVDPVASIQPYQPVLEGLLQVHLIIGSDRLKVGQPLEELRDVTTLARTLVLHKRRLSAYPDTRYKGSLRKMNIPSMRYHKRSSPSLCDQNSQAVRYPQYRIVCDVYYDFSEYIPAEEGPGSRPAAEAKRVANDVTEYPRRPKRHKSTGGASVPATSSARGRQPDYSARTGKRKETWQDDGGGSPQQGATGDKEALETDRATILRNLPAAIREKDTAYGFMDMVRRWRNPVTPALKRRATSFPREPMIQKEILLWLAADSTIGLDALAQAVEANTQEYRLGTQSRVQEYRPVLIKPYQRLLEDALGVHLLFKGSRLFIGETNFPLNGRPERYRTLSCQMRRVAAWNNMMAYVKYTRDEKVAPDIAQFMMSRQLDALDRMRQESMAFINSVPKESITGAEVVATVEEEEKKQGLQERILHKSTDVWQAAVKPLNFDVKEVFSKENISEWKRAVKEIVIESMEGRLDWDKLPRMLERAILQRFALDGVVGPRYTGALDLTRNIGRMVAPPRDSFQFEKFSSRMSELLDRPRGDHETRERAAELAAQSERLLEERETIVVQGPASKPPLQATVGGAVRVKHTNISTQVPKPTGGEGAGQGATPAPEEEEDDSKSEILPPKSKGLEKPPALVVEEDDSEPESSPAKSKSTKMRPRTPSRK
ncbi:hypothetical protein DL768_004427 [Monosporascus sp. mg162]|nr:hypothetical protein DL768_004427 [Monosporascus sp. mg162]